MLLLWTFTGICAEGNVPLWQGKGRIVISSDGNEHDNDDWAATPLSLAILASQRLQDKLALYTYSDHVWGSNQEVKNLWGRSSYDEMNLSALGARKWFGFTQSRFVCAVDNPEVAYQAMTEEINKSSADNPLFIIAAGPMQVVGEALRRAEKSKRRYVTVISHSWWNNHHASDPYIMTGWDYHFGWTWDLMKKSFAPEYNGGTRFVDILDQNRGKDYMGLFCKAKHYDWILDSPARNHSAYQKGSWDWLYSRLETCLKTENGKICTSKKEGNYFDPSDAGMIVFLLTGIQKTSPAHVRELMENVPEK